MAEFTGRDLRLNEVQSSLATLQATQKARTAAAPTQSGFTTLPDGRVLDAAGVVIYTPTPIKTEAHK